MCGRNVILRSDRSRFQLSQFLSKMVEISTYQIGIFVFDLRACLSTFFFDRKCPVETKYSDLIGCDFNYRSLFRSWLRSQPIRSGFLFSTAHFRSKNKVLRHALNSPPGPRPCRICCRSKSCSQRHPRAG